MFARIIGKRATAVATSLAVVVGLAIVPAFSATAAEAPPAEPAPLVELVETPPAPPAEAPPVELVETPPAPPAEATPPAEPGEAPVPPVELVETPIEEAPAPQNLMRSAEPLAMGIQAVGISPSSVGDFVVGADVNIQFSAAGAENWRISLDGFRGIDMSGSGHLTGSFTRLGSHAFTVTATKSVWNPPVWIFPGYWTTETVASQRYTFDVVPGITTTSLPEATVGVGYSQALAATPDDVSLATEEFTLVSGSLPAGLVLNRSTGTISGTVASIPTNPVTYNFAVRYSIDYWFGGSLHSAPQPLSITVGYPAPVVTTTELLNATVGVPYPTRALTATGQGTITWSATGLPAGLSIDAATGVISGSPQYNPDYGDSTAVTVTVIADNGRASAPRALTLTVLTPAPQFGAGTLQPATVGEPYDATLPLYNAYGHITFIHESGTLPNGLQLTADGHISGTPAYDATAGASKYVEVRVSATGTAGTHSKRFNFQLLTPAPVIDTDSLATGWWKQAYSQVVAATGPGVVVTVSGLPTGLSFDGTNITGSTRLVGDHDVTITATNSAGAVASNLTLTINAKPDLDRMPVVKMETGEYFWGYPGLDGAQVTLALGADAPSGMTLDGTNLLEWTPAAPGVYKFSITATNPAGSDTQKYTFRVFDVPVITQGDLDQGVINMPFRQKLQHDGTNVKFSIVRGHLPDGLTLTRKGVLKGVPTEAGVYSIKVRAKNPVGVDTMWLTVTVLEPAMTASASSIIRGGSVTVSGSGYLPGDTLELWLHSTPVLLGTVTATGGAFSSTVVIPANTAAGQHHLVVQSARSGTQSVPLTVAMPPVPAAPQSSTPQSQSPQLATTPGDDEPAAETEVDEAEQSDDTVGGAEEDEELPTLNEPKAEVEAAAETPANLSGLLIGGFALLLAALALWFILWRRRRATDV